MAEIDYSLPFQVLSSLMGNLDAYTQDDVNTIVDKTTLNNPFGGSALNEAVANGVFNTKRLADERKTGLMGTYLNSMFSMLGDARTQEALAYQKQLDKFNQDMQLHNQGYADKLSDYNLNNMLPLQYQTGQESLFQMKDKYGRTSRWDDWDYGNRNKKNGTYGSSYGSGGGTQFYGDVPWGSNSFLATAGKKTGAAGGAGGATGGAGVGGNYGGSAGATNTGYANPASAAANAGNYITNYASNYGNTVSPPGTYNYIYNPAGIPQYGGTPSGGYGLGQNYSVPSGGYGLGDGF